MLLNSAVSVNSPVFTLNGNLDGVEKAKQGESNVRGVEEDAQRPCRAEKSMFVRHVSHMVHRHPDSRFWVVGKKKMHQYEISFILKSRTESWDQWYLLQGYSTKQFVNIFTVSKKKASVVVYSTVFLITVST